MQQFSFSFWALLPPTHPLPQCLQDLRSRPLFQSIQDSTPKILGQHLHIKPERFHIEVINLQHLEFPINFPLLLRHYQSQYQGKN